MRRRPTTLLLAATTCCLAVGCAADAREKVEPEAVLARASAAFRALGSFRGEMVLTVTQPGQDAVEREIGFGTGPEGVFIDAGFQRIVATEGRIVVTQLDIEDRYVSAPFDGDFDAALASIGGEQLQIPDLPPIELFQSQTIESWIDAFRLKMLGPLTLADETSAKTQAGERRHEIHMAAENGTVRATFDAEEGLLLAMDLEATPAGAPPSMRVHAAILFNTQAVDGLGDLLSVDVGKRTAVTDLTTLNAATAEVGAPLPDLVLDTLRGERVALASLRGDVVVLDFWASWCGPCWGALEKLEAFVAWAEGSGAPVTVWAVNTAEDFGDPAAQREYASRLWHERGFAMDSLVDPGSKLFAAMGAPGLPSTVILTPEGTVAEVHLGVLDDMQARLRAEVEALLEAGR